MTNRLSNETLAHTAVRKPAYERADVTCGIVHLGIGAFHRAHQAVYTDDLLATGDTRWGITGASLRSTSVRDTLAPQDFLYTVSSRDGKAAPSNRVIGSVLDVLALSEVGQLERLCELISRPSTHVITLTITEKGYCSDQRGELDTDHPDIQRDLASPLQPVSTPGVLALALRQRFETGSRPLTILSCDNLSGNGRTTAKVVRTMLSATSPEVISWLDDNVAFPSSMVDRIVPAITDSAIAEFENENGYLDNGLLTPEPFSQWVIEDRFAGDRPDWASAGAQLVRDVHPFEQAKLRLLNATHSALAYLGLLAGYETVHEAIKDPAIARYVQRLLDEEITPVVDCPTGMNVDDYKASVLQRFSNSAVPYRTAQVASDGSQKLPQRIHPSLFARLERGLSSPLLSGVVAAWLRCLQAPPGGVPINDPSAAAVASVAQAHTEPLELIQAIVKETDQFNSLAMHNRFQVELADALAKFQQHRATAAIQAIASQR
ncbi:MAG: mannitol dehydrogenase family protein [Pseudomonadaceae bacterium]|nr:mannitol dehydrogenase family protein [Pseudomonadaceae bacterium]